MSEGKKFDNGKPRMDLISSEALRQLAAVLGAGAEKYGDNNWRAGIKWSRIYAAILRHLTSWNEGETTDQETGLNHLAHAMCGLSFLLEYGKTHPELDDRYVSPSSGQEESEDHLLYLEALNDTDFYQANVCSGKSPEKIVQAYRKFKSCR